MIRSNSMICSLLVALSVPASHAVRLPSGSAAVGKIDQHEHGQGHNYGLVGNMIAEGVEKVFGPSTVISTPPVQTSDESETLQPIAHVDVPKATVLSPLKGVKELLQVL